MTMKQSSAFTLLFTGLPASGKTTLSQMTKERLVEKGLSVELFDGDVIRKQLGNPFGYSPEGRELNLKILGLMAQILNKHGVIAIIAAIAPYRKIRDFLRQTINNYVEIYLDCPVEECIKRDPKGLYKKAMAGEIKEFTGISAPYEKPVNPEIVIPSHLVTPQEACRQIIQKLTELGYLKNV